MQALQSPHDALFRYVFSKPGHAAALLASLLPRTIARAIDWSTLVRDDTTLVDRKLRRRATDLLFAARLRRTRSPLHVLPEHLSTGDPFIVLELLGYAVRIWERCRRDHPRRQTLPPVLAFLLHHGDRPWRGPRGMRPLVDLDGLPAGKGKPLASMTLVVADLTTMREEELRDRRLTGLASLAVLFLQHLRHADDDRAVATFRRWRRTLVAVADSPTGQDDLEALFSYLHATTDLDLERLSTVLDEIHPAMGHTYMTTAERMRRKGIKEGIAKGRAAAEHAYTTTADRIRRKAIKEGIAKGLAKGLSKGRAVGTAEGRAAIVLRLLQQRFGPLPDDAVARIRSATSADLDRYADLVLSARTLAEVLGSQPQ